MLYCHILLLKLIFYVEILCFYSGELKVSLQKNHEKKLAIKAYKALWNIYSHLNQTFSLGVLFTTLAQYMSIIFCCYHALLGGKIDLKSSGIFFTLWTIFSVAIRTATSIHRFETGLKRTAHTIASDDGKIIKMHRESFWLKKMHQKLSFSVEKLYSVDNKHIINVSFFFICLQFNEK